MLKLDYIQPTPTTTDKPIEPIPLRLIKLPAGFGCDEFCLAETPITEAQWCAVMGGTTDRPNYPKVNVSYDDAVEFCAKASEQLGCEVRLPTEFEWCRAVGMEPAKDELDKYAVYDKDKICEVKTKLPNEYGLYDMRGLVWEWLGKNKDEAFPLLRGGSWAYVIDYARAVYRNYDRPGNRDDSFGFRVIVGS